MTSAIKMNNFLLNKSNEQKYLIDFNKISKYKNENVGDTSKPYFFLNKELNVRSVVEYNHAKQLGKIRHVIAYKGKWFDYIVKREFNTLSEWAIDAGGTIDDILFGVNRVHELDHNKSTYDNPVYQTPVFVTLEALLDHLGYVHPPTVKIPKLKRLNTFTDIVRELDMSVDPLHTFGFLVHNTINNTIITANIIDWRNHSTGNDDRSLDYRLICRDETGSNPYSSKIYLSISQLPEGDEVYFKKLSDNTNTYHSLKKVLNLIIHPLNLNT